MKKFITKITFLLLVLLLGINLASCNNSEEIVDNNQNNNTQENQPSNEGNNNQENNQEETTSSNILVVYYSATNNTERVALIIADLLDADTFEIVPTDIYTSEDLRYNNSDSRVSIEHNDPSLRDVELVSTEVTNWDTYDTVLIGYPIWWGIAAWPTSSFVDDVDWTGKTVIPFCTSASSSLGQSDTLLAGFANGGTWLDGHRFGSSASEQTIQTWIDTLNLR